MRRTLRFAAAIAVGFLCLIAAPSAAIDVPYLTGRVVDNASILKPETRDRIAAAAKAHEQATGNQVVVLTVPTIQPESVEDYAVNVFQAWKLGQKDKDNGVLLLVVPQDRKVRIEVGYGLEPTLTDGACGQIIRSLITPAFKAGDYDKGVETGVSAVIAKLDGTRDLAAEAEAAGAGSSSSGGIRTPDMPWTERILIGVFIFGIIGLFTVIGLFTPGVGWFLYFFLIPFWAMFPIVVVGTRPTAGILATYLIGFPIAKLWLRRKPWYAKAAVDLKTKGRASIGGFTFTSGGSSGSSSGWSSGGGGFSGGGGSSGGGGASGSW
jgi:uncharacterized protein